MGEYSNKNLIEKREAIRRDNVISVIVTVVLVVILLVLLYLKTAVFMVVSVKGSSMYDTLSDGDLLFANKLSSVSRGDVVVIHDPEIDNEALIKRVIGLGGDELWAVNGYVYITYTDSQGERVTERLIEDYVYREGTTKMSGKITVPEGCIFVMGDNRTASSDSRFFGAVKLSSVMGVVPEWSVNIKDSGFIKWYKGIVTA